jgi:RNA polymerase sigma factor (sigma-70 family)
MPAAAQPIPFQRFVDEQAPRVASFLRGMLGPQDAEDCLQETFIAALRAYEERFDGRNPRAWVLAIARRKAIDFQRASARRPEPTEHADRLAAEPPRDRLDGEIWSEVERLPEKQRAALVLRYALDLRHREIGAVLGCSEAAARRSVHEGIAKLRRGRVEEVA